MIFLFINIKQIITYEQKESLKYFQRITHSFIECIKSTHKFLTTHF